jgi:hypothetical protein
MPDFQVRAPARGRVLHNLLLSAPTWIEAMKQALEMLCPGTRPQDVLVEFQGQGVVLVEIPALKTSFRVIDKAFEDTSGVPTMKVAPALVPPPRVRTEAARMHTVGGAPQEKTFVPPPAKGSPATATRASPVSRPARPAPAQLPLDVSARIERALWMGWTPKAAETLLHAALDLIPSESGAVFELQPERNTLRFATAWGPRARRLIDSRIELPAGAGIAGYCTTHGVSLCLQEPQADTRFDRRVSDSVNYAVRSMITVPIGSEARRIGCIQLLNRKGGGGYTHVELALLGAMTALVKA